MAYGRKVLIPLTLVCDLSTSGMRTHVTRAGPRITTGPFRPVDCRRALAPLRVLHNTAKWSLAPRNLHSFFLRRSSQRDKRKRQRRQHHQRQAVTASVASLLHERLPCENNDILPGEPCASNQCPGRPSYPGCASVGRG